MSTDSKISRNEIVRVTKTFSFEMAHALYNYDGPCQNVHGHSYKLSVTVSGIPSYQPGESKDGMVMDFSQIKAIVQKEVIDVFDHALVLNEKQTAPGNITTGKILFVPYQPTCENLLLDIKNRIADRFNRPRLYSIRLDETATSYSEWFSTDNN